MTLPDLVQTLPDALGFWAMETPDAPALRSVDGRTVSHRTLTTAVWQVARRLAGRGVRREDRVALLLPADAVSWIALLGTMAAATAVPLGPGAAQPELARDLRRIAPRMLIAGRCSDLTGLAGLAQPDLETIFVDQLVSLDDPAAEATPAPWRVAPDATATILHTSGTTGLPKRVPRAHATFVAAARAEGASSGLTPRDVLLLATGPHTKAGQANMFGALLSGGSCVVVPRFEPECLPGWLADHQPTWMFATAAQLNFLLDALVREGHQLHLSPRSRLRLIRTGSQPMTPGTLERAERMLGATVLDGYGMSEVSCIAASGPHAVDRREGSCGRPWAAEVRIVAESDLDHLPGNAGEIVVRGPTLFSGYLDDPAANAAAFLPGGWFRTGDLGFLDREGYLYLTGRRSEIINRGGEKIAPLEVDQALLCHPAVAAAASFSVPDDRLGEDLIAAVVVRAGTQVTARDLRAAMLDRLSPFKVPHRIWFVPDLPRTSTGKVQRQALARLWEEQRRARGEPGSG